MILYGITIATSAFLLFLVQPIIAKQILPWFGGTASVWTVCVVFFQALLLAGYAYAHFLTRATARTQARLHAALLIASIAALPIVASSAWKPGPDMDPTWRIVGLLAATIGLPYFVLSSTGPLIQKWVSEDRAVVLPPARVYRLFALSNAASLIGLVSYPFVIEPHASLNTQAWSWSAGYLAFALAGLGCAWRAHRRGVSFVTQPLAADSGPAPTAARYAFWLACAALGSMLLLAITNHVTQNIASIPFLWVLPLSLYLLSFVVVFEGRGGRGWYVRRWWQAPVLAAVVAMAWALSARRGVLPMQIALPLFCIGLFLACVFCHGELARDKPAPAWLTQFYLCLAAGGAIGGLFVALVAPNLFTNYWETPLALGGMAVLATTSVFEGDRRRGLPAWAGGVVLAVVAAACLVMAGGGATVEKWRTHLPGSDWAAWTIGFVAVAVFIFVVSAWSRATIAIVGATLLCTAFFGVRYVRFLSQDTLVASRNFYGALRVKELDQGIERRRELMHGVILHGDQYLNEARRRMPTTYYGPASGIGLALRNLRPVDTPLDVAMIGLGAGTSTAWGRAGDRYHVYDINPAIVDIAQREFTYLSDSAAAITLVLGDARLSMERELASGTALPYDVIAVDAFSSDAIPVHLITREALDVFLGHLKPDGVVAFHVSNRFLDLAPVVRQIAEAAGCRASDIVDEASEDIYLSSEWVLVTRNGAFLDNPVIAKASTPIHPIAGLPMWTDQFNNLFKILK